MVRTCAVRDCPNNFKTKLLPNTPFLLFHRFPSANTPLWHKWVEFCNKEGGWIPSVSACMCSEHFTKHQYCGKKSDGRRLLVKNAIPTIPVQKKNVSCEDDNIRLHTRKRKKRKAAAPSDDVESLLEKYFNGEEVHDELPPVNEETTEGIQEVSADDERDGSVHEVIENSFTAARICDSSKARQIASEILSSKSDMQMLVVVTPEDLHSYNQRVKLDNKVLNTSLKNTAKGMKTRAGTSATITVVNNSKEALPNKSFVQHKENDYLSDKKLVKCSSKVHSQKPDSIVLGKSPQKKSSLFNSNNSQVIGYKTLAITNKKGNFRLNKVMDYPEETKEFCNNLKVVNYREHNELNSGARKKSVPFSEVTNTKEVTTSSDELSPQSSPKKSVQQCNKTHLSSVFDCSSMGRLITSDDEEDPDFLETPTEPVDIVEYVTCQSGKRLLFEADDNDLRILNNNDASYAYSMSPLSSVSGEYNVPDDFSNSSVASNSNKEEEDNDDEAELEEGNEGGDGEEVEAGSDEEIELGEVIKKENHYELTSAKNSNNLSSVEVHEGFDLAVKSVQGNNKCAEERVNQLNQLLYEKDMEIKKLKRELFKITPPLKESDHVKEVLKKNFCGFMRELALHEYESRLKTGVKRVRYREDIRTFAKTIFLHSPNMYRYVRTLFRLPHPSSLRLMLKILRSEAKTDKRNELISFIHGTDFSCEFEGSDDSERRVEVNRSEQIIEIFDNESVEKINENNQTEDLARNQQTAEKLENKLTDEMPNNRLIGGEIENDTSIESSQLLQQFENCDVYFEDADGNTFETNPEQIIEFVGSASRIIEDVDNNGHKRYVLLKLDEEENIQAPSTDDLIQTRKRKV